MSLMNLLRSSVEKELHNVVLCQDKVDELFCLHFEQTSGCHGVCTVITRRSMLFVNNVQFLFFLSYEFGE